MVATRLIVPRLPLRQTELSVHSLIGKESAMTMSTYPSTTNPSTSSSYGSSSSTSSGGDALDRLSDRAEAAVDRAGPMLDRLSSRTQESMHRGVDAMRDASDRLRERAGRASDMTVGYIQQEPVKSVLIAAAVGAAVFGIAGLVTRWRHH
ncbi:MAG TPA: hypothetical protein VJO99_17200 [Burkholderiaceae bacterium]|nr:hypothetical protein [Burkholderiaceae bacterium]